MWAFIGGLVLLITVLSLAGAGKLDDVLIAIINMIGSWAPTNSGGQ